MLGNSFNLARFVVPDGRIFHFCFYPQENVKIYVEKVIQQIASGYDNKILDDIHLAVDDRSIDMNKTFAENKYEDFAYILMTLPGQDPPKAPRDVLKENLQIFGKNRTVTPPPPPPPPPPPQPPRSQSHDTVPPEQQVREDGQPNPPRAPEMPVNPDVAMLTEMGFELQQCIEALAAAGGNIQRAVDRLLNQ